VLRHLATLFNNTNAVCNPYQSDRLCTVCSAKQLRNPAKFICQLANNMLEILSKKCCPNFATCFIH